MPVDFLTATQRQRYGRYPDSLSADELARNFHLDDDDRECIANKRRDSSRLGFALQLVTVRFLGAFLEDPAAVPFTVLHFVAAQIEVADLTCVAAYRQSEQRWRHTAEIRARCGYSEFVDRGVQFRLGRWLCALCWTGTDRPSLLFDHASGWLIGHKVLLPGISILERFVAEVRSRMEARLWRLLVRDVGAEQQRRLDELLAPVEGSRQSWFDRLRKGPVRVSGPALVHALLRVETVRGLGIKLPATPVPPSRIAALARFANTVKVSAVTRLPVARRTATLVAFIHSLEASAQDDALDVLAILLRDLFTAAEQADRKARLRSLKDLDRAASTLAEACRLLLDPSLPDGELRERVYAVIGQEELAKALTDVSNLVRPSEDVFYQELAEKRATVRRFLPILLRVVRFDSNAAARPLLEALQWLHERPDHDPPIVIVDKPWQRHVLREDGRIDERAFTFCALDKLRVAIRRRDVFVSPSWRYADPHAGLLTGTEWEAARPMICRSLGLSALPEPTLTMLAQELDATYRAVAARLPQNKAVRFETVAGKPELVLSPLDKLEDPPSLLVLRDEVKSRMPRVDLPEILLEIAARADCMDAFSHLTERTARATDLTTSLCAVLLAEACKTGPEPFVRQDTPALRRDRLLWVDQNYVRDETLTAANTLLVAAQSRIPLARTWGGGDVASADGIRFVVPVRTIHAGPNPKYFNRGRGVTWYNLLSDQATGLNAITVPGTLRDSLVLLSVVLEQQTELQPTHIMTDTGAYSDVVFGLFRLLGYRFCPRLADIGGTRFWRIDPKADYGELNSLARQRVSLERVAQHWDDVMRLIGSLKLGRVSAMNIMRTLQVDDSPTHLAQAIAEIGRIDKTIHTLNYIDDETRRRSTLQQLNLGEGRHSLARDVFHGKRGELHQRYREGQEDQLSALGLVVNMIVLWNTIYMDAVLDQLRAEGYPVLPEDEARLSPFGHEHINMLGRYSFAVPEAVARGELRLSGTQRRPDGSPVLKVLSRLTVPLLPRPLYAQCALWCRACGASGTLIRGFCRPCYLAHRHDSLLFGGWRLRTLERDRHLCRVCGEPKTGRRLHVHYRKPGVSREKLLISLCPAHHAQVHRLRVLDRIVAPLLAELWREQHPGAPEQLVLGSRPRQRCRPDRSSGCGRIPVPDELALAAAAGKGSAEAELTALVLNGVTSEHSKRAYGKGLALFFAWVKERGPQAFSKALVQEYRASLLELGLAPATVNLRLSPLRKLAREMADNGMLSPELAAGIGRTRGVKQEGISAGNWLLRDQASDLLNAPDPTTLKGKRDRAMLALLVGCGLRRAELLGLNVKDVQQREGRWVIPDLCGKGNRVRTVPVPAPVKARVDDWIAAAAIEEGKIFRPVNKGGRVTADAIEDEKAVWQVVLKYARETELGKLSPHDLRRTCAKLCRKAGGDLEQIQLLLGHASIQTTERYLGTEQNLAVAVNDALGLELK